MNTETLLTIYVVSLLAILTLAGIYSSLIRKRFDPTPTDDRTFLCNKCGYVYTDDPDVDNSRCPQCGKINEWYRF
jgi:rubrerythrin